MLVFLQDKQIVQFRLAELQTEVEALRALIYRATEMYKDDTYTIEMKLLTMTFWLTSLCLLVRYDNGNDVTHLASMCKLKAGCGMLIICISLP